jgi:type IV pilus assembly protein PilV
MFANHSGSIHKHLNEGSPPVQDQTNFDTAQYGFSLIEVLISIIILSFGLLGMVGLQSAAIQANRDARLQSTAVTLARELAEMMRGNKDIALLTANNPYFGYFNTTPLAAASPSYCLNVASRTTPCASTTAIANAQMTEWLARINAELPGAVVRVCIDSQPFTSGLPTWTCTSTGTGATAVIKIGWTRGSTDRSLEGAAALERATTPSIVFPITPGNTV